MEETEREVWQDEEEEERDEGIKVVHTLPD